MIFHTETPRVFYLKGGDVTGSPQMSAMKGAYLFRTKQRESGDLNSASSSALDFCKEGT